MTNPIIKEVNVETGEEIEREVTAKELAQLKTDANYFAQIEADRIAREAARADLLAKLGITADEAKLLLG